MKTYPASYASPASGGTIKRLSHLKRGFTLIELLIVITIIGVLAVAILSAIDPIEQIRRAQDTGRRSDSAEFLNGLERFYTHEEEYPWDTLGQVKPLESPIQTAWVDELISKGEVKPQFKDRPNLADFYTTEDTSGLISVCFDPQSKTFQASADKEGRNRDGTKGCLSACYSCVPE